MDKELQNNLQKQFKTLPKELQDSISAVDLPRKLEAITKSNKLMIDQAGKLEMETLIVLLGLEPLENYIDNLVKNAGLSREQAIAVAGDVNEMIFKNVRETLKKISEENKTAEVTATAEKEKSPTASALQPSREEILAGIENPENIKMEEAVSISSLSSNITKPAEKSEIIPGKTEIKNNLLPEIYPETNISAESILLPKQEPYHENISPVENIVQSKMSGPIIVPKEKIVVEEKIKLPDLPAQVGKSKPSDSTDPYREPIN